ncbi:EAL domain-containing protein [Desulfovibrio sp. Fe33]|uniref:EAL domain-containing protein n=1 Tax=Desulfovibrio sp. Fe33 TaxID=3020842 RepID=UPI00234C3F0D|nr:EAL domain-containing protein [Desulfovibrio sp. Fe33]
MPKDKTPHYLRFAPIRILLPSVIMLLLIAGSVFLYLLPSMEKALLEAEKEKVVEITDTLVDALAHLDGMAAHGEISRDYAKRLGAEIVKNTRYGPDSNDYFWITDLTPRMIMHPYRPDLDGLDLTDYRDQEGKRVFMEFIRAARKGGDAFVEYHWQWQDHPERIARKLSHIRLFEPWGWIIGTGLYVDDVRAEINEYRDDVALIFLAVLLIISLLSLYIIRQSGITEKKKTQIQGQREKLVRVLQESEERYRTIADFGYDWELWIGTDNAIHYCSPACQRITGYPPERFFEAPSLVREIVIEDDRDAWDAYLIEANSDRGDTLDFRIRTADGSNRWLGAVGRAVSGIGGKPLGMRLSFRDITERKNMEEQLRHQALHDPLTNLANRTLCLDRLAQAMRRAKRRENYFFAVVFLDLDRFKIINDSLGHSFGDMVLSETASRLGGEMRGLDTVSRFGGDEFVLLLDELSSPAEAIRIIKRVRQRLSEPFRLNGNEVQTSASFGIVLSPVGDRKAADVLQHANIAMHCAKEAGRNRFKVFTERMLETAVDQMTLETDMRRGLADDEFYVVYQPIMDLDGSDVIGFEALARWEHPERGAIPPAEFIPKAEESGLIVQLGERVLQQALRTLAGWRNETDGVDDIFISVNLSSKQFSRIELDKIVVALLAKYGIPPSCLRLEITESSIMKNPESSLRILNRLRDAGVRFSIDDFGTGYSSLAQLQQLPVDTLKVDRTFIARMRKDPEDMEIVKAVIALGRSLDLDVIAEGVESPEQICLLLDLNCNRVQGFYFHEPMSAAKARELLKLRNGDTAERTREKLQAARLTCPRKKNG